MSIEYKDTLNLPQTDFPMKANLAQREPETLQHWENIHLYEQLEKAGENRPKFILADGPPYANGAIHIGHAVNKILKDFILKSKTLSGFHAPYVPGWDCHGLPSELNVEKQIGKPNVKVDVKTFRQKCREYVLKQVDIQREAFIRLGIIGNWQKPYLTMDYQYEADTIRALAKIVENGHLHKGYKPVHWCIECGSALAEAEVEYQDKTSFSIQVAFPLIDHKDYALILGLSKEQRALPISVVIWTTTPWTLPANEAVALHPEFLYAIVSDKSTSNLYVVASELVASFAKQADISDYEILAEGKGALFEGMVLQHPFYDKKVPIILGNHVTLETGTGCVHTAPAHGQEDFIVGQKYHLPVENPVDRHGCYLATTPLFAGEHVYKVNEKIIAILKERNHLLFESKIQHSYPHCWRHKCPLIFRATEQWFISMEKSNLRQAALKAIKAVQWIPSWGEARIENMVAERPDWCISRQRTWGVPIALFVHRETGALHPDTPLLMEKVALRVEKEGVDIWYELPSEELLGTEADQYEKVTDILDVWFDSGISHYSVLDRRKELGFPADLYLEGSDQHRGWFQSSLLSAMAMKNTAPYKQVLTHGFAVDAAGRKMSKSLGNVVAPEKVVGTLGADVLRLWVSATDYRAEMAVSDDILKQASDIYRRIRNTARFLLANLNGFDTKLHLVPAKDLLALDRFVIERARLLQIEIVKAYEEYQFHLIYQAIHNFCAIDLGSIYLDVIKDRQYTGKKAGLPRLSAQTALYHIAEALVRWVAPILSFTSEEIWKNLPGERTSSVFLSGWYDQFPTFAQSESLRQDFWKPILSIRDEVNKALETARAAGLIGSALEAEVDLYADEKSYLLLSELQDELRFVLITSRADVFQSTQKPTTAVESAITGLWIVISASVHQKCERCWHRRHDVNQNADYPGICSRCVENIAGDGEVRLYA